MRKANKKAGFTIIELMLAMVIFSLVLMGAMAGLVQIGRLYYRGITFARTQAINRAIVDEISQAVQFSKSPISLDTAATLSGPQIDIGQPYTTFFCIGPIRYSYAVDRKLTKNSDPGKKETWHAMWADEPSGGCSQLSGFADLTKEDPCNLPTDNCSNGRELLSENMRISKLNLSVGPDNRIFSIALSLAYGDDDLLQDVDGRLVCEGKANSASVGFCAISELETRAVRRVQ